jgi:hypothetical protein
MYEPSCFLLILMKMKKWIEGSITAGIAALIAVFYYQVAYGQISHLCTGLCRDNPYKYGFQMGKSDVLHKPVPLDDNCAAYGPQISQVL